MAGVCMYGGGHVWQGVCVGVGACMQERRSLKREVRILLECILVFVHRHRVPLGLENGKAFSSQGILTGKVGGNHAKYCKT